MKILFEHEKATIKFNEETNAIELLWLGKQSKDAYELIFKKGLEYLIAYKATCWLSDIRQQGVVAPAQSEWLQKEIIPKAVAAGLTKVAVLMDKDVFKDFYIKTLESKTQSGFLRYFGLLDEANAWLSEG